MSTFWGKIQTEFLQIFRIKMQFSLLHSGELVFSSRNVVYNDRENFHEDFHDSKCCFCIFRYHLLTCTFLFCVSQPPPPPSQHPVGGG